MDELREKRAIALKKVGISKKDAEDYRKSARKYYVEYRGREGNAVTSEILAHTKRLADIRRTMGVEIAGVIFEGNLTVTFIFYVNGDPEDAFFEKNVFMGASDFEKELERQTANNFIPNEMEQKHVIYKVGQEVDIIINSQQ